jgi:hypothetical protein
MSHDPDIITKIAASIAPKIKGQDDIKMAIACLLFGGSRKVRSLKAGYCGDILQNSWSVCSSSVVEVYSEVDLADGKRLLQPLAISKRLVQQNQH